MLRPRQLQLAAHPGGPQAPVAVERAERRAEAHLLELVHRPRRQSVTAGLLAWEVLALDDGDVVAGAGQPVARRGARGPTADDEDFGVEGGEVGGHDVRVWRRIRRCGQPPAGVAARGSVPMGNTPVPAAVVVMLVNVTEPSLRPVKIAESSLHHFSNSAEYSALAGSAPP